MKVTFLIGNGFDINLGLDTKYSDFIKVYKKTKEFIIEKNNNGEVIQIPADRISKFKFDIDENEKSWADAEIEFGNYTKEFNGIDGMNAFLDCHADFCKELGKYLENQENSLDYTALKDPLGKAFIRAILNTAIGFTEVQKQQIAQCYNSVGVGLYFNFISFNYTMTLDKCIDYIKKNKDCLGVRRYNNVDYGNRLDGFIHVHGYTDHEMALGLNDESQIANRALFDDAEEEDLAQIIKRETNKLNEQNIDEKATEILYSSDFIYIYGMSIGETDAIWWQRICKIMMEKPNLHVVIHQYDAPDEELFIRNFRKYERKIRAKFFSYYESEIENSESVTSRIHITKANIFSELREVTKKISKVKFEEKAKKDTSISHSSNVNLKR